MDNHRSVSLALYIANKLYLPDDEYIKRIYDAIEEFEGIIDRLQHNDEPEMVIRSHNADYGYDGTVERYIGNDEYVVNWWDGNKAVHTREEVAKFHEYYTQYYKKQGKQ